MPSRIVIDGVRGDSEYRLDPDADPRKGWVAARAGVALREASEIRTGLDGVVRLRIGDTQVITIERFARVSVRQAIHQSAPGRATARTVLELDYGRMVVDLDSTRIANDVKIEAPDVVLAASGTTFIVNHVPGRGTLSGGARGNTGTVTARYANGQAARFTGQQQTEALIPDPARLEVARSTVETANPRALEADERAVIARSTNAGEVAAVSLGVEASTLAAKSAINSPGVTGVIEKQPPVAGPSTGNQR